ncbi:MAG: hypothetical protein M1480_11285 [Bacteroidetes bacterium]|nr:hypothetical protein [Bacteroidota bacterium]
MNLISILYSVLLVAASVLCIALIVFLNKIAKAIKAIEYEIKEISIEIKPLIASTTNLSEKLNRISESADDQLTMTKNIVKKVNDRVDTILDLEEKVRSGFEGSVLDLIKSLSAIANGISAFWNAYRKK